MPVLHVLDVPHRCAVIYCATCGAAQSVPFTALQLGTEHDPNTISVPSCESCGSQEFLNRTFDTAPEAVADHRKKVNAIAVALKAAGRVHSKHAALFASETRSPAQVGDLVGPVARVPGLPQVKLPDGMRLPS